MSQPSRDDDLLFRPHTLGSLALPNRLVMAPMTRSRAGAGLAPTALNAKYYAQRASAGLIVSEGTQVSQQGQGYIDTPGMYSDAQVAGWKLVTDATHRAGGRIFAQLWHVGRISHSSFQPGGGAPVAPSAITAPGQGFTAQGPQPFTPPRALETAEVAGIVADFGRAAQRARDAGFDGVELHGANGYLIDQFLRDGTNHRTDRYGGSVENRARFLLELLDAVTAVWGPERVGVRVSPVATFNGMSDSDPLATFGHVARELGERRVGYLHVVEPIGAAAGARITPALRERYRGKLIANGGYDGDAARAVLARGEADLVSFGTRFLANPDLPARLAARAPLNAPDRATFYGGGAKGYTDYAPLGADAH